MQKWLAATPPVPVDDAADMIRWVAALPSASQAKLTSSFRRRIDEMRVAAERASGHLIVTDPDYAEFERSRAGSAATDAPGESRDRDSLADLKLRRDFAIFKLHRAQARGSIADVKDSTEQIRHISGVVHDEELRAQRLGREIGDILPRPEAERIFRALPYWLLRGVDDLLATLCKRLAAASASGPLFPEEVRALIEPDLLSSRVLAPIVRATQVNAGTTLPTWAVDSMRAALAAALEDAPAEFARLYATPPPAPIAPDRAGAPADLTALPGVSGNAAALAPAPPPAPPA